MANTSALVKPPLTRTVVRDGTRSTKCTPQACTLHSKLSIDFGVRLPFGHAVRPGWPERIPAVVRLDGTVRIQTVAERDNSLPAAVLTEYEQLSGVPVPCDTSADDQGRGLLPKGPDIIEPYDAPGTFGAWTRCLPLCVAMVKSSPRPTRSPTAPAHPSRTTGTSTEENTCRPPAASRSDRSASGRHRRCTSAVAPADGRASHTWRRSGGGHSRPARDHGTRPAERLTAVADPSTNSPSRLAQGGVGGCRSTHRDSEGFEQGTETFPAEVLTTHRQHLNHSCRRNRLRFGIPNRTGLRPSVPHGRTTHDCTTDPRAKAHASPCFVPVGFAPEVIPCCPGSGPSRPPAEAERTTQSPCASDLP
ncbi:hypothetical protein SUDANB6_01335 [Streptomyces sp. enrichment culture]